MTETASFAEQAEAIAEVWYELSARRVDPRSIVDLRLRKTKKTGVFLLPDAFGDGRAVVAKREAFPELLSELSFYRAVAPLLPMRTLELYGHREDGSMLYLFIEDAGRRTYTGSPEERLALTDWLAEVHLATATSDGSALPPHDARRYLGHLQSTRRLLVTGIANEVVSPSERSMLADLDALLERLETRWASIEGCTAGAPCVLVHGDLVPKNIHVLVGPAGPVIVPLDWETAGWGIAAADLSTGFRSNPHLSRYVERTRDIYPGWDAPAFERLTAIGSIFCALASMDWVSGYLAYEWVRRPVRELPLYESVLRASLAAAGLGEVQ